MRPACSGLRFLPSANSTVARATQSINMTVATCKFTHNGRNDLIQAGSLFWLALLDLIRRCWRYNLRSGRIHYNGQTLGL